MAIPAKSDATQLPLYIVFQPVMRMGDGPPHVYAYESLLRVGPNDGNHTTQSVIESAELNGTMPELDSVIAQQVCGIARQHEGMRLWINLSQTTLSNPSLSQRIGALIERLGLACRVTLEITETADGDEAKILESLRWLRSKAITVVIDDIEDGFAKSHLLRSDLVGGCKLSRRSTVRMGQDPKCYAQVQELVEWCKANGKTVVMEGIETEGELAHAVSLGVDYCQGFYFWAPAHLDKVPAPGTAFSASSSPNAYLV